MHRLKGWEWSFGRHSSRASPSCILFYIRPVDAGTPPAPLCADMAEIDRAPSNLEHIRTCTARKGEGSRGAGPERLPGAGCPGMCRKEHLCIQMNTSRNPRFSGRVGASPKKERHISRLIFAPVSPFVGTSFATHKVAKRCWRGRAGSWGTPAGTDSKDCQGGGDERSTASQMPRDGGQGVP